MYILKKLNREKNVSTEAEYKALLAEGWEDVTPSQAGKIAESLADIISESEKRAEDGGSNPDEGPSAEDGGGSPDEEPSAEDGGGSPDKKPRRGSQK